MDFDNREFVKNRKAWTYEQTQPYFGQQVAWQLDGKAILAAAPTWEELFETLDAMGAQRGEYLLSYIPDPVEEYGEITPPSEEAA